MEMITDMLHIGHFSFDAIDRQNEFRHGYFTLIADVGDADAALAGFSGQIMRLQNSDTLSESLVKVYLEDIIQVQKIPEEPVFTHLQSSQGSFPPSISYSLPQSSKEGLEAFGLTSNVQQQESQRNKDGYLTAKPLMTFESRPASGVDTE
jgi:hypothetical protein